MKYNAGTFSPQGCDVECSAPQPLADVLGTLPEPSPPRVWIAKEEHMGITRRHLVLAGAGALCTAALGLGSALAAQSSDEAAVAQAVEAFVSFFAGT